jgi:hypothetical protein
MRQAQVATAARQNRTHVASNDATTLEPTGFHEREHLDGRIARTFGDLFFAGAF